MNVQELMKKADKPVNVTRSVALQKAAFKATIELAGKLEESIKEQEVIRRVMTYMLIEGKMNADTLINYGDDALEEYLKKQEQSDLFD